MYVDVSIVQYAKNVRAAVHCWVMGITLDTWCVAFGWVVDIQVVALCTTAC